MIVKAPLGPLNRPGPAGMSRPLGPSVPGSRPDEAQAATRPSSTAQMQIRANTIVMSELHQESRSARHDTIKRRPSVIVVVEVADLGVKIDTKIADTLESCDTSGVAGVTIR